MTPSEADRSTDLCRAFRRNPDGSWTCVETHSIVAGAGRLVTVQAGETVRAGELLAGYDLAGFLDRFCDPGRSPE